MSLACVDREDQFRGKPRRRFPHTVVWTIACLTLSLIPPAAGTADENHVRELLVDWANTPEEHASSASFYAKRAQEARQEAVRHQEMGVRYLEGEMKNRLEQKAHCERIASLNLELASEYEGLARNHRREAERYEQGTEDRIR